MWWYYYRKFMAVGVTCLKKELKLCTLDISLEITRTTSSHQFLLPLVGVTNILS